VIISFVFGSNATTREACCCSIVAIGGRVGRFRHVP
jgi:hypothetical protein